MAGIVPPSVVTYQYTVDNQFSKYVNVSFPFRVRITDVWFSGDASLLNISEAEGGNNPWATFEDSFRVLKLAGHKAKNPKVVLSNYDTPSDWNAFFGTENDAQYANADSSLKPTIWLGIPDEATAQVLKDSTTQYNGVPFFGAGFRSSTGRPPAIRSTKNGYWFNNGWNTQQWEQHKYKTDIGVMNPDEILSLFVYNDQGDWTNYDGTGTATIHVAYTGVGEGVFPASGKTPWSDWWYD